MKQVVLPLFLLLVSHFAFSQRDPNGGKYFEFTENVKLKYCDAVGAPAAGEDIINSGIQFKIDGTDDMNDYIIHVLYDDKDNGFNNRFCNANYSALRMTGLAYSAIDVDSSTTKGFAKLAANPFAVTGHRLYDRRGW